MRGLHAHIFVCVLCTTSRQGYLFFLATTSYPLKIQQSFENSNFLNFFKATQKHSKKGNGGTKNRIFAHFLRMDQYEVYLDTDYKINAKSLENISSKSPQIPLKIHQLRYSFPLFYLHFYTHITTSLHAHSPPNNLSASKILSSPSKFPFLLYIISSSHNLSQSKSLLLHHFSTVLSTAPNPNRPTQVKPAYVFVYKKVNQIYLNVNHIYLLP